MPVQTTYPGVYIEEVPSGVRTITGVATSIAAFIGRAKCGSVNEAKVITSYADYERSFGGLDLNSAMSFAVRDFYRNGGSQAVIVRLFHPDFKDEAEREAASVAAKTQSQIAAETVSNAAAAAVTGTAEAQDVADAATDAVDVAVAATPQDATDMTKDAVKAAAAAVADAATAAVTETATAPEVADAALATVSEAVDAAVKAAVPVVKAQLSAGGLDLEAISPGAWGNHLRVRIDYVVLEEVADSQGLDVNDLFNISIRDTKTGIEERFLNVSVVEGPRRLNKVLENESHLVRVVSDPLPDTRPEESADPADGKKPWQDNIPITNYSVIKKATDGKKLNANDYIGVGKEAAKEGLYALEQTDLFNLLCLPPDWDTTANTSYPGNLLSTAASYCEDKRRAMLLVDPPSEWIDTDKAVSGIGTGVGTNSKNAAIFFPRIKQTNPLRDSQLETFVPCGVVAGIFARTDSQRGVWKAPAGMEATLRGVAGLTVKLTDEENGRLNPLGVNCLRTFPIIGRTVWGSRTLKGADQLASEWKYIPVRRTALFIEESLYRGTQWVVFEPNDEPLWAQIRLNVGAFMHNLFRQGAFQGTTPRDAYFVKCDKETTTQNDIDRGIVNIVVGFAPLKPAEFVIIKLQQIAGELEV